MNLHPDIIGKLSSGGGQLWHAGHDDGSGDRINGDKVLEASSYGTEFGVIAAVSMGLRKLFRNRNKTREDLEAEKEALRINNTCGALNEMLLEYIQAVQKGAPADRELLSDLADTLDEMHKYYQAGKLAVPGKRELSEIRKSIGEYTAGMTGERPAGQDQSPDADDFALIREQLLKQKQ